MVHVQTRKNKDGKTEYYCYICEAWMKGHMWNGTGYTELLCDGCDLTFDDDYLGEFEYEKNLGNGEEDERLG